MFRQIVLILLTFSAIHNTHANDAQRVIERQRLESVVSELAYIKRYLQQTHASQKHDSRTRFNYEQALNDLDLISSGISEYLTDVPNQPKRIVPHQNLSGAYTK